jgi:hypothetical protein
MSKPETIRVPAANIDWLRVICAQCGEPVDDLRIDFIRHGVKPRGRCTSPKTPGYPHPAKEVHDDIRDAANALLSFVDDCERLQKATGLRVLLDAVSDTAHTLLVLDIKNMVVRCTTCLAEQSMDAALVGREGRALPELPAHCSKCPPRASAADPAFARSGGRALSDLLRLGQELEAKKYHLYLRFYVSQG